MNALLIDDADAVPASLQKLAAHWQGRGHAVVQLQVDTIIGELHQNKDEMDKGNDRIDKGRERLDKVCGQMVEIVAQVKVAEALDAIVDAIDRGPAAVPSQGDAPPT